MARARILVVEDERLIALDIRQRLVRMGYEPLGPACAGSQAIELSRQLQPDVILMDIHLDGDMDGIAAAGHIRVFQDVPIVFLTACSDEETLERAQLSGPLGYVLKPFGDRELTVAIEMARHKHSLERRLVEKQRLLDTTLASIADAVVCLDLGGRVTFLNNAALAMLGAAAGDILGQKAADAVRLVQEDVEDLAALVLASGSAYVAERPHQLERRHQEPQPVALTISPLRNHNGGHAGTVLVMRDLTERHTAETALQDTVRKLTMALDATVQALAVAAEKRDPYTSGHQLRVAELALAIAAELGIDDVEGLRVAANLHDLGKISVPAEILSKPNRLNDLEMGLMKTHSSVGHEILRDIPFPWPVASIVLQHHERLDGSGYPLGLAGEAILPEARILAVADVVEAMSSHRPYRAALGVNMALREISAGKDRLYDPEVVEACMSLFYKHGFMFGDDARLARPQAMS